MQSVTIPSAKGTGLQNKKKLMISNGLDEVLDKPKQKILIIVY